MLRFLPPAFSSLITLGILLAVAFVFYFFRPVLKHHTSWSFVVVGGFLALLLGTLDSWAVLAQLVLYSAIFHFLRLSSIKRAFFYTTAGAAMGIYGVFLLNAWLEYHRFSDWRETYDSQSLDDLIPLLRTNTPPQMSAQTEDDLKDFERRLADHEDNQVRQFSLGHLHRTTLTRFIHAPGFGVRRVIRFPEPTIEYLRLDKDIILPQPGTSSVLGEESLGLSGTVDVKRLQEFHRDSLLNFLNPRGFGWGGRSKVAGFQAHFFRKVPTSDVWRVRSIELVGLIQHGEPVVYKTANLPRMEELRDAPTRQLDDFETMGMEYLHTGETLFMRATASGLRLIGAIRSTRPCIACHGGEVGGMLGAFSYQLSPAHDAADR